MLFEFGLQSSLLLVFFIHGLVYAFLLYRKGKVNETRADQWLSLFLLLCVLYISPWMLGFGGWYDNQPYRDILFYVPFQQLYFIGPVIFFYVQSLLNPSFRFGKKEFWHLLPGILYLLFSIVMVVTDKLVFKKYFFLANGTDPDFDTWYQVTGFVSMFTYFILSLRYYSLYKKLIVQLVSYAEVVMYRWVRNFLMAFLIMLLVRVTFFILGEFFNLWYGDIWWYFMVFALIFYYIAITGYANSVETRVPFRANLVSYKPTLLLEQRGPGIDENQYTEDANVIDIVSDSKEQNQSSELVSQWKPRLEKIMQEEKSYQDPELSLTQLAKALQTNPSLVSMVINKGFSMNFNDWVNKYRLEEVKSLFEKGEHKKQTLLSIAFECGFNSKATFNRAFKKATGLTPREWLSKQ